MLKYTYQCKKSWKALEVLAKRMCMLKIFCYWTWKKRGNTVNSKNISKAIMYLRPTTGYVQHNMLKNAPLMCTSSTWREDTSLTLFLQAEGLDYKISWYYVPFLEEKTHFFFFRQRRWSSATRTSAVVVLW